MPPDSDLSPDPRSRAGRSPGRRAGRTLAADERAAIADALQTSGPDAPTLCEGWTCRDLAAHLVLRETRPDTVPGMAASGLPVVGPVLGRVTERSMTKARQRPFDELVDAVRSGPPRWNPLSLPALDAVVNSTELFIHHEDVRRAVPGWSPRDLGPTHERLLWGAARLTAGRGLMGCPVGVVLVVPDGPRSKVRRGTPAVVLSGPPSELLLHLFGRREHSLVDVNGDPEAVEAYRTWAG